MGTMAPVTETKETPQDPAAPDAPAPNEDDKRASAAAVNRKRALDDWEEKKKRWRSMGVPKGLPARK